MTLSSQHLTVPPCVRFRWEKPALEFEKAGVGLTCGESFLGGGYVRINFACPRATLEEALRRIEKAVVEGYREGQRAGES